MQTTSLSAGSRLRVTPLATICASQRMGAPPCSAPRAFATTPGEKARSSTRSTIPQAWIIRTATCASSAESPLRSLSARMVANDCR